jgi:hypothetical protein
MKTLHHILSNFNFDAQFQKLYNGFSGPFVLFQPIIMRVLLVHLAHCNP